MGLLRRAKPPQCHYCLSPSPEGTARVSSRWCCTSCGCWNARDAKGNILGDHPAMRNPEMNKKSFSLRARPDNNRLPTGTPASPFCRDCQTNQILVMNLLSNYLPDESDPSYPSLAENLPNYITSLHARYPPVCAQCQPGVDDALRRADQRAQAEAWGRALRRGVEVNKSERRQGPSRLEVVVWRARGFAWCADAVLVAAVGLAAWLSPLSFECYRSRGSKLPYVSLRVLAILWALWDPTWLRRARSFGELHARGRGTWVSFMLSLYLARLFVACFLGVGSAPPRWLPIFSFFDLTTLLFALTQLRLAEPVALTLVRPVSTSPTTPQTAPSPPQHVALPPEPSLQGLSLSNIPTPTSNPNPVFGQTSLQAPQAADEPMDWEPSFTERSDWDSFGAGRQRMFESPSNETGLESLLASWGIGGPPPPNAVHASGPPRTDMTVQPRPILGDTTVRNIRVALLTGRIVALIVALGCRFVGISITHAGHGGGAETVHHCLLGLEGGASALALVVALATGRVRAPLAAVVLGCDAAVRTFALLAPPLSTLPILYRLSNASLEIVCAAWTALDAVVLAAT